MVSVALLRTVKIVMKRYAILALLASVTASAASAADPVELSAFIALARPEPTLQVRYGAEPPQGIDIFLPAGSGPHPVAILIHGGCWSTVTAGREQLRHLGADLAERGIAVWSIGYRRANEAGGGYPGTFQDVSAAIDRLPDDARTYHLTCPARCWSAIGRRALALWAAARGGCRRQPVHVCSPFMPCGDQADRSGRS